MNPKTGEILALVSTPSYDPNKLNITNYQNPFISYTYEPGSTMKIFSFMSAIEEGKYKGDEKYHSGKKTILDYTIKDWNKVGWGSITYDVGFTYSSNIAAANLAERIGKKKLAEYYDNLGFGQLTNIELANESKDNSCSIIETKEERIIYSIPKCASAAVGFHTVPNNKLGAPTSNTAGAPFKNM